MSKSPQRPQWSPSVRPDLLKRLYASDASGYRDESLLDEVAYALYARCEAIYRVTKRLCPECGSRLTSVYDSSVRDRPLSCQTCSWKSTWRVYHSSYKRKRLHGGGAFYAFERYYQDFPTCRSYQEKIIAIDRLIHGIHRAGMPGIMNLLRCRRGKAVRFLDDLAYGDTLGADRENIRQEYRRGMKTA